MERCQSFNVRDTDKWSCIFISAIVCLEKCQLHLHFITHLWIYVCSLCHCGVQISGTHTWSVNIVIAFFTTEWLQMSLNANFHTDRLNNRVNILTLTICMNTRCIPINLLVFVDYVVTIMVTIWDQDWFKFKLSTWTYSMVTSMDYHWVHWKTVHRFSHHKVWNPLQQQFDGE